MANNNIDPQIMAQLMQMYQQGQINIQNPNMNMNPFGNNNQTVFIPPNSNQFNANNMFGMGMNNMNFVNNMNNVSNQNQNQGDNWLITFEKKPENSKIDIQISSSEIVSNAYLKYREKSMLFNTSLKFTYKGKPLDATLSLSASGLSNNATITVEQGPSNSNTNQNLFQNNPNQLNLLFENQAENSSINIQVQPDKLVKDAVIAYKNKIQKDVPMIFIYNSKTLDENMSLKDAGITASGKILVVQTGNVIGAYFN